MDPDFTQMKVPDLKKYLQARGISVSNKRKEELLELCCKAHELGIEVQDDEETSESNIAQKLMTADGQLPQPYSLKSDWTTDFSSLPNYTWGDMYAYLIVKEGYDHESLKAYSRVSGSTGMVTSKSSRQISRNITNIVCLSSVSSRRKEKEPILTISQRIKVGLF